MKLHNIGQRTIEVKGKLFAPNTFGDFDAETADYLRRLYPDEVRNEKDSVQNFASATVSKSDLLPPPPAGVDNLKK